MSVMGTTGNSLATIKNLKLITFDVTGTLLRFVKPPVEQYIDMGRKYGVNADESAMNVAFKQQWSYMNQTQPHFGKCWRSWWTQFVIETFKKSKAEGAMTNKTLDAIASDLIDHFTTAECWEASPGAEELLKLLRAVKHPLLLETKTPLSSSSFNDDENCVVSSPRPTLSSSRRDDAHDDEMETSPLGTLTTSRTNLKNLQIGVLSNFDARLEKILQVTHLHPYFNFLTMSHECQVSKPQQGIFDSALLTASTTITKCNNNKNKNRVTSTILPEEALHIGDNYELDYVGARTASWNAFLVLDSAKQKKQLPPPDTHLQKGIPPPVVFSDLNELRHFFQNIFSSRL